MVDVGNDNYVSDITRNYHYLSDITFSIVEIIVDIRNDNCISNWFFFVQSFRSLNQAFTLSSFTLVLFGLIVVLLLLVDLETPVSSSAVAEATILTKTSRPLRQ